MSLASSGIAAISVTDAVGDKLLGGKTLKELQDKLDTGDLMGGIDCKGTLAANIATEIPEAPVDGTLYRTLFLSAVVLFGMTFVLNTLADVIRQRLRKQFGQSS